MTPDEQRFFAKIDVGNSPGGCWMWIGSISPGGYGQVRRDGRTHGAHRYAYDLLVGRIPEGHDIDHLCRERACVNPLHLETVTRSENLLRGEGVGKGNSYAHTTHCAQGHPFDEANTIRTKRGRTCRTCKRAWDRARYLKRRAV